MALDIYFLNVGHGDCTVVKFPSDRLTIVDVNNSPGLDYQTELDVAMSHGMDFLTFWLSKSQGQLPYSLANELLSLSERLVDPAEFLKAHFPGRSLFRFILTHPDMDHMSGLYRLFSPGQENISLANFWDTGNDKEMNPSDFEEQASKGSWEDWDEYTRLRNSLHTPKVIHNRRGDSGQYWSDDAISVLSPTADLVADSNRRKDWNQLSYVLMLEYAGRRVVLGGDADTRAWADICEAYTDEQLKADILKASHHGRDSGYHQPAVKAIDPTFTVVSVGKKPETDASNKYRHYSNKVMSTRFHGTIHARIWQSGSISIYDWTGNRIDEDLAVG